MGFICLMATEPLREDILPFATKPHELIALGDDPLSPEATSNKLLSSKVLLTNNANTKRGYQ